MNNSDPWQQKNWAVDSRRRPGECQLCLFDERWWAWDLMFSGRGNYGRLRLHLARVNSPDAVRSTAGGFPEPFHISHLLEPVQVGSQVPLMSTSGKVPTFEPQDTIKIWLINIKVGSLFLLWYRV